MKLENIDSQLQEVAEFITERGLNFGGGEFEYLPTGEDWVLTISKKNWAVNHDKLVEVLVEITADYVQLANSGDAGCWSADDVEAIVNARKLLKELGHEI